MYIVDSRVPANGFQTKLPGDVTAGTAIPFGPPVRTCRRVPCCGKQCWFRSYKFHDHVFAIWRFAFASTGGSAARARDRTPWEGQNAPGPAAALNPDSGRAIRRTSRESSALGRKVSSGVVPWANERNGVGKAQAAPGSRQRATDGGRLARQAA